MRNCDNGFHVFSYSALLLLGTENACDEFDFNNTKIELSGKASQCELKKIYQILNKLSSRNEIRNVTT